LQDEPPDPVTLRGELSPTFVQAVSLALAKDADKRPSTAGDYARSLGAAAENSG
jgi:hypothetical protein